MAGYFISMSVWLANFRTWTIGSHHVENVSNTSSIVLLRLKNWNWRNMIVRVENRKHFPKWSKIGKFFFDAGKSSFFFPHSKRKIIINNFFNFIFTVYLLCVCRVDRVGRPALKKLASLAVYTEDESNDLSDLGIGTSSASGKSSLSEDYDNNSVMVSKFIAIRRITLV